MTGAPHQLRCPPANMEDLEDRVRRWKQAGYQTFSISVDEMLDIIDRCASHSSTTTSVGEVLDKLISSFDIWDCPPDPCHHNPDEVSCRKCIIDYIKSFRKELRAQERER